MVAPKIALQRINGLLFVDEHEILHANADGNYTEVHLSGNRSAKVPRQIGEIERLLKGDHFVRIHRSHLINLGHVIRLDSGTDSILMANGKSLPLARDRKAEFINKFTRI